MKSVLMSIRKPIADTIFNSWTKRLEYRTRWNKDFKGRVYVYESGKDGGKVAGFFDVGGCIHAHRDNAVNADDWVILDRLDQKNFDEFWTIKAHATPSVYAIEITNVHRFTRKLSLSEFCHCMLIDQLNRPPQSWQYIEYAEFEVLFFEMNSDKVEFTAPPEGKSETEKFMTEVKHDR